MRTPICDFVRRYADSDVLRLHMPGHKGSGTLGMEALDITEIGGADSLYEASGIIRESEKNAGMLFGADTFYSAEGSSLCIRAMLYLILLYAARTGRPPLIAAGRNAHKTFLTAAALLDFDILWLYPHSGDSYLCCSLDAQTLEETLARAEALPAAVYLTSPDYLGNMVDLAGIAAVCKRYGVLLAVDNAHGAYLKFLPESRHPIDLGADICCDSAHKTLPVLTGGAYLHVSHQAPDSFSEQAKTALAMFGSTSPSYLILQSLDAVNAQLASDYPERLAAFARRTDYCRKRLAAQGLMLMGDEPLKLTLQTKSYGYTGKQFAALLEDRGIVCEFADPDFVVLMLTPELGEEGLTRLEEVVKGIPQKAPISQSPPLFQIPQRMMSVRAAALSECERVDAAQSIGRILAMPSVGCPPAVPLVVCGERIDETLAAAFSYYGIRTCTVIKS